MQKLVLCCTHVRANELSETIRHLRSLFLTLIVGDLVFKVFGPTSRTLDHRSKEIEMAIKDLCDLRDTPDNGKDNKQIVLSLTARLWMHVSSD